MSLQESSSVGLKNEVFSNVFYRLKKSFWRKRFKRGGNACHIAIIAARHFEVVVKLFATKVNDISNMTLNDPQSETESETKVSNPQCLISINSGIRLVIRIKDWTFFLNVQKVKCLVKFQRELFIRLYEVFGAKIQNSKYFVKMYREIFDRYFEVFGSKIQIFEYFVKT